MVPLFALPLSMPFLGRAQDMLARDVDPQPRPTDRGREQTPSRGALTCPATSLPAPSQRDPLKFEAITMYSQC